MDNHLKMNTEIKRTLIIAAVAVSVGFVGYKIYKNCEEDTLTKQQEYHRQHWLQRYRRPLRRVRSHRDTLFRYSPLRSTQLRRYSMLNQESSSLPLEHQYEPLYADPNTQPLITAKPLHLSHPIKEYMPARNQWMVQFQIPQEADQVWQFKLSGPGVASAMREAHLMLRTDDDRMNRTQVHRLSTIYASGGDDNGGGGGGGREQRNIIYLDNGDVVLQFLDKPLFTRNMYHLDMHVQLFLESSYEPQTIDMVVWYGILQTDSKRDLGHVVNTDFVSADGKRFSIKALNGSIQIRHDNAVNEDTDAPSKWNELNDDRNDYRTSVGSQYMREQYKQ